MKYFLALFLIVSSYCFPFTVCMECFRYFSDDNEECCGEMMVFKPHENVSLPHYFNLTGIKNRYTLWEQIIDENEEKNIFSGKNFVLCGRCEQLFFSWEKRCRCCECWKRYFYSVFEKTAKELRLQNIENNFVMSFFIDDNPVKNQ